MERSAKLAYKPLPGNYRFRFSVVAKYIVLSLFAVSTVYPFVWVMLSSFKTESEIYGNPFMLPHSWNLNNYRVAWQGVNVLRSFTNSVVYCTVALVVILLVSSLAAYILARVRPNKWLYVYFSLGMMIPLQAVIIPLNIIFRNLHIVNTPAGLIVAYIISNLSFSIFILVAFMRGLPFEIEESAAIDGCSRIRIFFQIVLPISKGGLATAAILAFISCWNDLLLPLTITSNPLYMTLNLAVYNLRAQYVSNYGTITAGIMLLTVPAFIVYILFQEQIIKGMAAGAIKG
jgi:ABC-type glycerol-3-phosphate transport system permease component